MAFHYLIDPDVDTDFYDSVRRLLGGVDEETIDNETIKDPIIFDTSELEVIDAIPCAIDGSISTKDKEKARLAMIYMLAIKLVPTVRQHTEYEVRTIDVTWKRQKVDYTELEEKLLASYDALVQTIQCYEDNGIQYSLFEVAPSKRAVKRSEEL